MHVTGLAEGERDNGTKYIGKDNSQNQVKKANLDPRFLEHTKKSQSIQKIKPYAHHA